MRRTGQTGPTALYLSELSEVSRRSMRRALTTAAAFFGGSDPDRFAWHRVWVDRVSALRAHLASRLAPNTANKVLAPVRWTPGSR